MYTGGFWYENSEGGADAGEIAKSVFRDGVDRFCSEMTSDPRKISLGKGATCLSDIQSLLASSIDDYNKKSKWPKARQQLQQVATTIHYYSSVLSILSQHHPEYVALAWGAIKLLLLAFLQHEDTILTLTQGLVDIAQALPRVELRLGLYPTAFMKDAASELYAYIIRFFIRALDWYQDGTVRRIVHSITRPQKLRYGDLLGKIQSCTKIINGLAVAASQAELRDVHTRLKSVDSTTAALRVTVQNIHDTALQISQQQLSTVESRLDTFHIALGQFQNKLAESDALRACAVLDTNDKLSDIQLGQILASMDPAGLTEHIEAYNGHMSMKRLRSKTLTRVATNAFWMSPRLKNWSHSDISDLAVIKGSFQSRSAVRDFAVDVIDQLQSAQVPVIWALKKHLAADSTSAPFTPSDLLRLLTLQAIRLHRNVRTEKSMALSCAQVGTSCTEHEWFQVLESALDGLAGPVYVVIDMESLAPDSPAPPSGFNWPGRFLSYFESRSRRGSAGRVKVLLTGCGTHPALGPASVAAGRGEEVLNRTIQVRTVKPKTKGRVVARWHRPAIGAKK